MIAAGSHAATAGEPSQGGLLQDGDAVAINMLRLALGRAADVDPALDWAAILDVAAAERCAVLAWHRSAAHIRAAAPPAVVARWRALAVEAQLHGARYLKVLAAILDDLERAGIPSIVLKGPPLSLRLYADSAVRASADLDLYIPGHCRADAETVLLARGWRLIEGNRPWTQTLALDGDVGATFLEVHSTLADLNLLHLGLPEPRGVEVTVDGRALMAHDDDLLPAYLASHAAKHMPVALLYFIDFLTLWSSLTESERAAALDAARVVKLAKYLQWALARANAVERAATGQVTALRMLGVTPSGRRGPHAMFRDIILAQTPLDATRAAAAWLFPPHLRHGMRPLMERWAERLRKPWSGYALPGRESARGPRSRPE